jgi:hypothetical protein
MGKLNDAKELLMTLTKQPVDNRIVQEVLMLLLEDYIERKKREKEHGWA